MATGKSDPQQEDAARNADIQSNQPYQQQANAQQQPNQQKQGRRGPMTKDAQGNEIPLVAAPRFHATEHVTRQAQRAVEHAKNRANPGVPQAATPEARASASWRPMPAGGLAQLMAELYPDDGDDPEAMADHYRDLFLLNQDHLRTDTDHAPGQMVRIPS